MYKKFSSEKVASNDHNLRINGDQKRKSLGIQKLVNKFLGLKMNNFNKKV